MGEKGRNEKRKLGDEGNGDERDGGRREKREMENRERRKKREMREMEEGLGQKEGRRAGRVTLPKRQQSQRMTLNRLIDNYHGLLY